METTITRRRLEETQFVVNAQSAEDLFFNSSLDNYHAVDFEIHDASGPEAQEALLQDARTFLTMLSADAQLADELAPALVETFLKRL